MCIKQVRPMTSNTLFLRESAPEDTQHNNQLALATFTAVEWYRFYTDLLKLQSLFFLSS